MCKHLTHKGFRQFVAGADLNCPLLSPTMCEEGFGDEYRQDIIRADHGFFALQYLHRIFPGEFGSANRTAVISLRYRSLHMSHVPVFARALLVQKFLNLSSKNLGTNRWSLRPELGASKAFDPLTVELSAGPTFFTDNTNFLNGHTRSQDPIVSGQAQKLHLPAALVEDANR